MTCALLVQRELTSAHLGAVTSQAGCAMNQPVAAATNIGFLTTTLGSLSPSATAGQIKVVDAGNIGTATIRQYLDGSTYLGRKVDSVWDGNGYAWRTILADTAGCTCSRPVAIDRDGDGVIDRVLIAILRVSTTPDQIDIYYTDDLSGTGAWASLASNVTSGTVPTGTCRLVLFNGVLYLSFATGSTDIVVWSSSDDGVTWAHLATVVTSVSGTIHDMIAKDTRLLLLAYEDSDGANDQIYCKSSTNGANWSSGQVVTTGATNKSQPSLARESSSVSCFYSLDGTGIAARYTTEMDPGSSSWTAYPSALWGADTNDSMPSVCVAPDYTVYAVFADAASTKLQYSKRTSGAGNFAAAGNVLDIANLVYAPQAECIGGAIWCAYFDSTANDINLVMTRYWTAYDVSTAPASWTSYAAQYLGSGVWLTMGGSSGQTGDYWTYTPYYTYGADRLFNDSPKDSYRSAADNLATAYVNFDMGAAGALAADAVAVVGCNLHTLSWQMDDAYNFVTPTTDSAVSFQHETGTVTAITGNVITASAKTWTPHRFAVGGTWRVKMTSGANSGLVYVIADNGTTRLHCSGDLTGVAANDTFAILSPCAYKAFTADCQRYVRWSIPQQQTAEDYYEIGCMYVGTYFSPTTNFQLGVNESFESVNELRQLASGRKVVNTLGDEPLRKWTMRFDKMPSAEAEKLKALVRYAGVNSVPVAFVPDTSVTTDVLWGFITAFSEMSRGSLDEHSFTLEIEEQP